MKTNNTYNILKHWYDFNFIVILEGIIIGFITGIVVVAYRVLISHADVIRNNLYNILKSEQIIFKIGWFLVLAAIGILLGLIVKKAPMIKGSGIPQIKGFLLRQLKLDWIKEVILKFIGGVISLGFGLSLGREGPSVQLGATLGLGFSNLFKRFHIEEKYLVTAGASAGLAAAFNAPLAGVIFALEELHHNFSPLILLSVMGSSITADFVSSKFFGLTPVFNFSNLNILPFNNYIYIILLGIIIGILGKLFNDSLIWIQKAFNNNKINDIYKPIFPMILSGILGLTLPAVLGGGHELIVTLSKEEIVFGTIIFLFVVKLLFTVICYGSGVPGGIFLPILVLGALVGKGFGQVFIQLFNVNEIFMMNFITLAMAAYFTAVVKAPITGSILITEMTGSFNHLLPLITICMVAYIVTDLLGSGAIYDILLENMLKHKNNYCIRDGGKNKVLLEIPVSLGSGIEHKRIKDVLWPPNCLIVGIRRGEKEIIPKGDNLLYIGDYLIFLTDEKYAPKLKVLLLKMAKHNTKVKLNT